MNSHSIASLIVLAWAVVQTSGGSTLQADGPEPALVDAAKAAEDATSSTPAAGCCAGSATVQPVADSAKGEEYAVNHCPLSLMFVMNDVYYFYCQVCNGSCSYAGATDHLPHAYGSCQNCPQGTPMCSEPISVGTFVRVASPGSQYVPRRHMIASGAQQPRPVPPRSGAPGKSGDADGRVVKAGPWVRHVSGSDRVVKVLDGNDTAKYFRVLALVADPPLCDGTDLPPIEFHVGQQLAANPGGVTVYDGCLVPDVGDARQHVLHIDEDAPDILYYVLSHEDVVKPITACPKDIE
jgi:hypothetical protein